MNFQIRNAACAALVFFAFDLWGQAPSGQAAAVDTSYSNPGDTVPRPVPLAALKKKSRLPSQCPEDMEYVIADYQPKNVYEVCVDRYEFPNQPGRFPAVNVTWYKAKSTCASMGKYLCWDSEWLEACRGLNNWDYGYYNLYDSSKCNADADAFKKIGEDSLCKTRNYELFDLVGNVREWTGGGGIGAYGGSYKNGRSARCSRWDALSIHKKYDDVGFRCCLRVFTGRYGKVKKGQFNKSGGAPADSGSLDSLELDDEQLKKQEEKELEKELQKPAPATL